MFLDGNVMKSDVFFSDLKGLSEEMILKSVDLLLERVGVREKIREKDLVAIKLHFGEKGNTAFIRPVFLRRVVDRVKAYKGKPFLTDTNTLYRGMRQEAISHLSLAYQHGFAYSVVDAPILIADGLRGNSAVHVRIDKPLLNTVSIARDIHVADVLIGVTHFKGHELSGFGGTLKNLGMGRASREGKLNQHSNISPQVKEKRCNGCRRCLTSCAHDAILMKSALPKSEKKVTVAFIDPKTCVGCGECILTCPTGAVQIQWNESIPLFQKKMVEHAYGAVHPKKGKAVFLNFLTQITPACDCNEFSETPIVPDVGILASEDPVAIDQASADLVNQQPGNRASKLPKHWEMGEDKFRALYPEVDWSLQLSYGEEIGLGSRSYELIKT